MKQWYKVFYSQKRILFNYFNVFLFVAKESCFHALRHIFHYFINSQDKIICAESTLSTLGNPWYFRPSQIACTFTTVYLVVAENGVSRTRRYVDGIDSSVQK